MGGFGSIWHWVIVLLVIVLLFGAKRIPELAKGLGSGIKNFKKAIKEDDEEEMEEIENKKQEKITATKTEKAKSTKISKED
ncbi:twin-arginine translocase TatA/TatE family subunit [Helicobacter sp. faydin-H20]|uniref:twin-arginine translocase TatA/TatE family subunit n=1 Tax=Helicobacter anatolicus TaxID=2905874 RepID=UPI001E4F70B2|nr:twin-arginine translocase TatA/TatE family subunit [Helicobacter anatolicus]MCE3036957.1 twin-arginine translocase TatA/TatE family subunit [Helicobacter anatolicus]